MKKSEVTEKEKKVKVEAIAPKRVQTAEGKRRAMLRDLKGAKKKIA